MFWLQIRLSVYNVYIRSIQDILFIFIKCLCYLLEIRLTCRLRCKYIYISTTLESWVVWRHAIYFLELAEVKKTRYRLIPAVIAFSRFCRKAFICGLMTRVKNLFTIRITSKQEMKRYNRVERGLTNNLRARTYEKHQLYRC